MLSYEWSYIFFYGSQLTQIFLSNNSYIIIVHILPHGLK